jgi:hypothetical protein
VFFEFVFPHAGQVPAAVGVRRTAFFHTLLHRDKTLGIKGWAGF